MKNAITDVPGIKVGHAQNIEAGTGCTVIICEKGAVTGVDVRGGAPGTRELACLDPVNFISKAHSVYLGGGSAYGLDGAGGVMKFLEEKNIGQDVGLGVVPIVPGAVLYDLNVGRSDIRPDKEMGYSACCNADSDNCDQGNIGAGTGASIGKINGPNFFMKGGLGTASEKSGDLIVGAIVAVNCFGDIIDFSTGKIIAGALSADKKDFADSMSIICASDEKETDAFSGNTTIGCIATNAKLNKSEAVKVAMMAHDGFARAINPIHTPYDGDTTFCMATGEIEADLTKTGAIAAKVMAQAIINAVKNADSLYGLSCYKDIAKGI